MTDLTNTKDERCDNSQLALSKAVTVNVRTRYLTEQSQPGHNRFVYSYEITITNNSPHRVQLLSRHWLITEEAPAHGQPSTKEVKGPGVIGQQPIIEPQQSYTYSSGSVITTPIGTMKGSYQMQTLEGEKFDIEIPLFALIQPNKLH